MKINKLTKIIIIIFIVLSISITITASNLGYLNKIISNKSPKPEKELVQNEVEHVGVSIDDKSNQQVPEEPIAESPVIKDPLVEELPIVVNPLIIEDTHTNETSSKDQSSANNPIDKENKLDDSKDKQNNSGNNKPVNNSSNNSNNTNKPNTSNNSNNNNGNDKKENDKKDTKSIVASKNISKDEAIEIGLNKIGPKSKFIDLESYLDGNPPKYVLEIANNKFKYKIEIHAKTGSILDYDKD